MVHDLIDGVLFVLAPQSSMLLVFGALAGLLLGILPGIRGIHGVVIFLPIAYAIGLDPKTALIFLVSIYYASLVSSRITTILEGAGSQPAALTAVQLRRSASGALCGILVALGGLALAVFLLNRLQISFGPAEYVVLVIFAFASLSFQSGRYPVRTLISTGFGVVLATIGIDSNTGVLRFTLGQPELYDGIEITTVALGIFVVSQILLLTETRRRRRPPFGPLNFSEPFQVGPRNWQWGLARGSLVGFLIGLLPGSGTSVAGRFSRTLVADSRSGATARMNEIVVGETARTAAAGGALVPMLIFCIPGSATTAVMIGALLLYNITPGPSLFLHNVDMIWGLFVALSVVSLLLFALDRVLCRAIARLPSVPDWLFLPSLIALVFIAAYAIHASVFSLSLTVLFGGLGYLLQKHHYPLIPLLLGFVLGELLEDNLRRALTLSGGSIDILFSSPICQMLWLLVVVTIIALPLRRLANRWLH